MMPKSSSNLKQSYVAVFLVATALYVLTCAPGVVWQDSGVIQYRVWHNDIQGKLGLALSHPLYYIIAIAAKYIPLDEFSYGYGLVEHSLPGSVPLPWLCHIPSGGMLRSLKLIIWLWLCFWVS